MRHRSKLIDVANFLKDKGEAVTSEWLYADSLKPYAENLNAVQVFTKELLKSLLECDIFVLISDPEGTDMFIELGACLAKKEITGDCRIYIIGKHSKRSAMQLHPSVKHIENFAELFKVEGIDYKNFNIPNFSI